MNTENTQRPDQAKADSQELTAEQKSEVQKLKQRNREVRNHEQAHLAAGGQHITRGALAAEQVDPEEKTKTAADYLPTAAEEAPLPGTLVDIRA
ncbi:MAG: putative metalloprotease CJM1_0395 family protein [Candidatus Krumholzibacteria bacterium]|nr:putative metalloprotease CJM1_0395 family protein [Candidatus Krumholzibacteria bacterium]